MWLGKLIDKMSLRQYKKDKNKNLVDFIWKTDEEKEELPTYNEKGQVIIRNLSQYRDLLKDGQTEFDFSRLDMMYEDIQQLDLFNLGLNINLQEIFFPFGGSSKYYDSILHPIGSLGDDFIYLNRSNLKGNNVIGDLNNAAEIHRGYKRVCTFIYNDDTFDEEYKKVHPQYFLDDNAPSELREKYYNPLVRKEHIPTLLDIDNKEEKIVHYRQHLTFEEFLQYYQFLHGKYIERFRINKLDYNKIKLVEALGLEQAKQIIENLKILNINPNLFTDSISDMSLEEIQTCFLNNNEPQATELIAQIDRTIKTQQKVLRRPNQ